jgi:hypothetical protein
VTRAGLLAVICAMASCAHAATSLHWSELPKALKGKTVEITTIHGVTHYGRFVNARADAIIVKGAEDVEVTRDDVSSIFRFGREPHFFSHLKELGILVLAGYFGPFLGITDPAAAVITIPLATAAGVVGLPVCVIWDLFALTEAPGEEIVLLPDPVPGVTP